MNTMLNSDQDNGGLLEDGARSERRVFSLWICDVHTMMYCQQLKRYYFQGWHVPYVRIFGTIVSAVPFASTNTYRYEVDDGTGVVTCIYNLDWQVDELANDAIDEVVSDNEADERNLRSNNDQETEMKRLESDRTNRTELAENRSTKWMNGQIGNRGSTARCELGQGDSVCIIGTVRFYGEQREVRVCQLYRIDNLEEETGLILQFVDLYRAYLNWDYEQ